MTVRLAAVGDICLGREVDPVIRELGSERVLGDVLGVLSGADVRFGNLECAVTERREGRPGKPVLLRAPRSHLDLIALAGFDVLSLANNHILDYGPEGLLDTITALDEGGHPHVGAGADREAAARPVIIESGGLRIAFLAAFGSEGAETGKPGVLPLKLDVLRPLLSAAREQADIVIASVHWGMEHDHRVVNYHRELGHELASSGVDVVLGHGAHVFQAFETVGDTLILYGLGNFLFDHDEPAARQGAVALIDLEKGRVPRCELVPFRIGEDGCLDLEAELPEHAVPMAEVAEVGSDTEFLKAVLLSKLRKGPIQGPLAVLKGLRHAPGQYYRMLGRVLTRRRPNTGGGE